MGDSVGWAKRSERANACAGRVPTIPRKRWARRKMRLCPPYGACRHSGAHRRCEPQMRTCASGNLGIPGSMLCTAPEMTRLLSFWTPAATARGRLVMPASKNLHRSGRALFLKLGACLLSSIVPANVNSDIKSWADAQRQPAPRARWLSSFGRRCGRSGN